ncbi:MAG: PadR family transcriptional regulator [Candidatus Nanopelagicales bacterium]
MDKDEVLAIQLQEIRRGSVVVACLLRLEQPGYGYELLVQLNESGFSVEGNTLYPLLRRLEDQGLLTSTWDTTESRPRKFYRTSKLGREVCNAMLDEIDSLNNSFAQLKKASMS